MRGEGARRSRPSDVHSGTAVELRVTMPRDPTARLPGRPPRARATGLPEILADEEGLDDDFNSPWNRAKRFIADHALLLALAIAALAALAIVAARPARPRARRRACPSTCPSRPTTPRRRWPTALANEGDDTDQHGARDPARPRRPRLLRHRPRRPPTRRSSTWRSQQKADRPAGELTAYEQAVLEFFDQLLDGEQVAISEMKDKVPKHSEVWRGRWERMTEKLDDGRERRARLGPRPQLGALAGRAGGRAACSRSSSSPTSRSTRSGSAAGGGRRRRP